MAREGGGSGGALPTQGKEAAPMRSEGTPGPERRRPRAEQREVATDCLRSLLEAQTDQAEG